MQVPDVFQGHPASFAIWIVTYAVCVIPEIVMSRRLHSAADAQKADKHSKLIVIVAANLAVQMGWLMAIAWPALKISTHWATVFAAGIVVCLQGTAFRHYSIRTLGHFFTYDVAISTGQTVVSRGPYRWLRHPSYLGSLFVELGFGMTLTNWAVLLVPVLCLGSAHAYRISIEEQALLQGLGTPYREYMQRTWRLIPFIF